MYIVIIICVKPAVAKMFKMFVENVRYGLLVTMIAANTIVNTVCMVINVCRSASSPVVYKVNRLKQRNHKLELFTYTESVDGYHADGIEVVEDPVIHINDT